MTRINGFDVSSWQGNGTTLVDNLPAATDFVYRKVSEGLSYVDPQAQRVYAACHRRGFRTGGYHFAHTVNSGAQEAQFFLSHLQMIPGDLLPAVDVEYHQGHEREYCLAFANEIWQQRQCECLLYGSTSFITDYIGAQVPHMHLWIADWADHLSMPPGWQSWAIWQYRVAKLKDAGEIDYDQSRMPLLIYKASAETSPAKLQPTVKESGWEAWGRRWKALALRLIAKGRR